MMEYLVADEPASRKPLALIKSSRMRLIAGDISRSQEYVRIESDPDWPRPVVRNGVRYYVEHEAETYVRKLIARSRGEANAATAVLPDPPPPELRPGHCRDCDAPLVPTGKRGRPPVRCTDCRSALRDAGHSRG